MRKRPFVVRLDEAMIDRIEKATDHLKLKRTDITVTRATAVREALDIGLTKLGAPSEPPPPPPPKPTIGPVD
jgi:hypothetical protein